jgi:hypothetical protein
LAGRMVADGGDPYDSAQWLAAHNHYVVSWRPDRIFTYPLPLAYFMAPIGSLPLPQAYFAWQMLSQALIAVSLWWLLSRTRERRHQMLFAPLMAFLLFFGPVYLTLQIGALGAFMLTALVLAIYSWEHDAEALGGLALSLTLLKPPQGATILLLAGVWLIAGRKWRALCGVLAGGLILFLVGRLGDPLWVLKFLDTGQVVLDRNLGLQSNALGFADIACQGQWACTFVLGGAASVLILFMSGRYLWNNRGTIGNWEAFNIILPAAFVSTLYLWSYDQLTYIIPIVWIALTLLDRWKSYAPPIAYTLLLVTTSLVALAVQANTGSDLLSIATSLLVLGAVVLLRRGSQARTGFKS